MTEFSLLLKRHQVILSETDQSVSNFFVFLLLGPWKKRKQYRHLKKQQKDLLESVSLHPEGESLSNIEQTCNTVFNLTITIMP